MKTTIPLTLALLLAVALGSHADSGPQLSPCLKENSTLCPVVSAAFEFEEASDTTRFDSVAGLSAVEPEGYDVGRRTGKIGSWAADFAGTDNSWLRVPGIKSFGPGWWTLAAWVYPDVLGSAGQKQTLFANDTAVQQGTHIYLENVSGSLKLKASVTTDELDTQVVSTSGDALTVGAWNFISVSASPWPNIYGQATLVTKVNNGTAGTATLTYGPRPAYADTDIGARVSQAAGSRTPFDGGLDGLRIFTEALNALQVQNLYNGGTGMTYPFTDPHYTQSNTLTVSGSGAYNDVLSGTCTDVQTNDGYTSNIYQSEAYSADPRHFACAINDPSAGGSINWIKVHVLTAANGTGSWVNVHGNPGCGFEQNVSVTPLVYVNSTTYAGTNGVAKTFMNQGSWVDPCGYGTGYVDVASQWTNNPATGLAWTYSDVVSLQAGATLYTPQENNGSYTLYTYVTYVYVEVNVSYN